MPSLIFCVEPGVLFSQAVLLAKSINQYSHHFFNGVYGFSPRPNNQLNNSEKQTLQDLGVSLIDEPLNTAYLDYPIANKILACLWAENNLTDNLLLMVDTDTIFLQPPSAINDPTIDLFMRPVDRPGQSSFGPNSKHEPYWLKAYELCDVMMSDQMISTSVSRDSIRPYFNAGFVAFKRTLGLPKKWLNHLDTLRQYNHHPNNPRCLDQISLAITSTEFSVKILPDSYNYPIPLRSKMQDSAMQAHQWNNMVHIHYHRWFQKPDFLSLLNPPLNDHPKQQWLLQQIPLNPVINDPFPH